MQVPTTKIQVVCHSIVVNMSNTTYAVGKNYETVI